MAQVSKFLRSSKVGYLHWCPGCEGMHHIYTKEQQTNGARWRFDGNVDCPSFEPSINCSWGWPDKPSTQGRCHYFIRGGQIQFCGDSTHKLKGQTVPLPELPERYQDGPQCVWSDGDE